MTIRYTAGLAAQRSQLQTRLAQGMPRRGWKVGINVPEVQHKLGLSHALVGWLDGDRFFADGDTLPLAPGSALQAEPELCLRLCRPLAPQSSLEVARSALDAIAPALEIVDYAQPRGSLDDIISHSMFHSACVLGTFHPLAPETSLDIAEHVKFRAGDVHAEPARRDLVPHDPAQLLLQVAARLAEYGEELRAGDLIFSGSFTARALPLVAGAEISAQLGGFGTVRCQIAR
jgi:2-keto-4-pentenoate hydratase